MDHALIVTLKTSGWESLKTFLKAHVDGDLVESKIQEAISMARIDYRSVTVGHVRDMIHADIDLSNWAPVRGDFYSPE